MQNLPTHLAQHPGFAWIEQLRPLEPDEVRQRKNETDFTEAAEDYKLNPERADALDAEMRAVLALPFET